MSDATNNLFSHSPKELTTDGFLTWILYFLNNDEYKNQRQIFFDELLLKKSDQKKQVSNIEVRRQVKIKLPNNKKINRADIILKFKLDGIDKEILFENKTSTTTTYKQLDSYKNGYKNCYRYIYLKLAYINCQEKELTKSIGYDTIDIEQLSNTLQKIKSIHLFVEHYLEYINTTFKKHIFDMADFLQNNKYAELKSAQFQQFVMCHIFKNEGNKNLDFGRNNGGRPWTNWNICQKNNEYGNKNEWIFWRIDKTKQGYYIRLDQYANIDKKYKKAKKQRLNELRNIANNIFKGLGLKTGKMNNKGTKQSKIIIFYFDDSPNTLENMSDFIPKFSAEFCKEYAKIS